MYRFHARDLHLVMGPAARARPVRFRVFIDGSRPAGPTERMWTPGHGAATAQRLYH